MFNLKLNFTRLTSYVSYLLWRLKKLVKDPKEEPTCEYCGGFLKYHAWSDCDAVQAMKKTSEQPVSAKAQEFYDRVESKAEKPDPDPFHGADTFSCVYRGPGGPGCSN